MIQYNKTWYKVLLSHYYGIMNRGRVPYRGLLITACSGSFSGSGGVMPEHEVVTCCPHCDVQVAPQAQHRGHDLELFREHCATEHFPGKGLVALGEWAKGTLACLGTQGRGIYIYFLGKRKSPLYIPSPLWNQRFEVFWALELGPWSWRLWFTKQHSSGKLPVSFRNLM